MKSEHNVTRTRRRFYLTERGGFPLTFLALVPEPSSVAVACVSAIFVDEDTNYRRS